MDEVFRIAGMIENCYLVKGEHCYLVDTGIVVSRRKVYRSLTAAGVKPADLSYIFITHYHADHTGSLARLKRESGATVAAGAEDVPYIQGEKEQELPSKINRVGRFLNRFPDSWIRGYQRFETVAVDMPLSGGETFENLGLEVITLPGHTIGGIGLVDRANRRAFVGDLVSGYLGHTGGPVVCSSYSLEHVADSLRQLAALDLDYIYPGHGRIVGPRASELVGEYVKRKY